ncbi:hypothetical protein [Adhaeribacter rhizoryzae]|uniref:Uncharacterized protein n=1 Tax=Adhaeribacter rhizoryzae TaxID=2607907 RepID=A0A5M6D3H9_9BACT|nr:hypothetical protein [Adhaeribacter rhizoryzae]KAA5542057.1 hypothetical protein F0145_19920 [Adhaeribacter rhizoryzae]
MKEAFAKAGFDVSTETWALLHVAKESERSIRNFFLENHKINPKFILSNLHITVYYSKHAYDQVSEINQSCHYVLETKYVRFMVMRPGGENPDPNLLPADNKVGIRIQKTSELRAQIESYREQLCQFENTEILGMRKPSTKSRNAFGAKKFQPHISLLKGGNGIVNLTEVADNFRSEIQHIYFDRFEIKKS